MSARLLRETVSHISGDLELTGKLEASFSSVRLVNSCMLNALALESRDTVLRAAASAAPPDGFICELGVYKGSSLNCLASCFPDRTIYGFDSFLGLPHDWRNGFPKGTFAIDPDKINLRTNCILYPGLFDTTLPQFLDDVSSTASLIHIDCDLYSSTHAALQHLKKRIRAGTIIIFDEFFNYPGWQNHEYKAFQEFVIDSGFSYDYLAYNSFGQQAAIRIATHASSSTMSSLAPNAASHT